MSIVKRRAFQHQYRRVLIGAEIYFAECVRLVKFPNFERFSLLEVFCKSFWRCARHIVFDS